VKKGQKNKAIGYVVVLVVLLAVGLFFKQSKTAVVLPETTKEKVAENTPAISITSKDIKEENFTGTMPVISGASPIVIVAQAYVDDTVDEFRKKANIEVPDIRKEFGEDSAGVNYEIDIGAKYIKSEKTESIVMSVYTYTGGAHGSSSYRVMTASQIGGKILSLSNVIKKDKQTAFTTLVKKELSNWRPEKAAGSVIFEDAVKDLTFDSFRNWSLDGKNLIVYFEQYEIGPGVLGPVAFPLSLDKIKDFLEPAYR